MRLRNKKTIVESTALNLLSFTSSAFCGTLIKKAKQNTSSELGSYPDSNEVLKVVFCTSNSNTFELLVIKGDLYFVIAVTLK